MRGRGTPYARGRGAYSRGTPISARRGPAVGTEDPTDERIVQAEEREKRREKTAEQKTTNKMTIEQYME